MASIFFPREIYMFLPVAPEHVDEFVLQILPEINLDQHRTHTMVFQRVTIAGPNGKLGKHFLPLLLASHDPVFEVSVLTRSDRQDFPPGVKVHKVDYNNHADLVAAVAPLPSS